ncbi:MAG: chloride channel protein [Desulfobacteraceae bacterium]|nr:chloride channel protein [Desulfobacteraceae bacterium]
MKPRPDISNLLDRWQPSEPAVLIGASVLVGLGSGAGVWLFKYLIRLAHLAVFKGLGGLLYPTGPFRIILLPVIGGLAVGLFAHFFGKDKGYRQGIAGIMEATAITGGRFRYQTAPVKAAAAAISIGSGASVGPEDPSVLIGASLGSMLGQRLRLSDERIRALVGAGAAAGISAAFNAPIAGVFFALEIILGEISGKALGVIVLSSVASAIFTQTVTGPEPAFHVPTYVFNAAHDLPLYLVLGLLAGPVSALYIRLLYLAKDIFKAAVLPEWLTPSLAGVLLGIIGFILPQILGVGYGTIEEILTGGHFGILLLLFMLAAKLVMTPVSIGGGFPGGVFAPSLFIGATLGSAYGTAIQAIFPSIIIEPSAFAMVGMAALLAGAVHAPLTAIMLLFEMTNDYHIILPLMFAVVVSMTISQFLQRDSVYTLNLTRRGIRIEHGRDVEVLDGINVSDVMQTDFNVIPEFESLTAALDLFMRLRIHGLPVVDAFGSLTGILTMQDIDAGMSQGKNTAGEACTQKLVSAYKDETLSAALRKMGVRDIGRLPVVDRKDSRKLVGILRRSDIIRAYDAALTQRARTKHHAQQEQLAALMDGVDVEELTIESGSHCAGQRISDLRWPKECIVASVRRGRRLMIPHGDTVLQEGDVLAVVTEKEVSKKLRSLCDQGQKQADDHIGILNA